MTEDDPDLLFYVEHGSRRAKVVCISVPTDTIHVSRIGDVDPATDFLVTVPFHVLAAVIDRGSLERFYVGIRVVVKELLVSLLRVEGATGNN